MSNIKLCFLPAGYFGTLPDSSAFICLLFHPILGQLSHFPPHSSGKDLASNPSTIFSNPIKSLLWMRRAVARPGSLLPGCRAWAVSGSHNAIRPGGLLMTHNGHGEGE